MSALTEQRLAGVTVPDTPPRIVVVDDSRASLSLYRRSLESLAVDLVLFESPSAGFEYLETHDANLLFLGNLMRETDGMTLLRRLRARPRHRDTAVVMTSTKDYHQDRVVARELGALDYLVKPVRSQEIRDVVTKYTGARVTEP